MPPLARASPSLCRWCATTPTTEAGSRKLMTYVRVATLKTPADLRSHLVHIGAQLPLDDELIPGPASPLAQPWQAGPWTAGNRYAVLPMEGWDGTADGQPSDLTIRRWQRFG